MINIIRFSAFTNETIFWAICSNYYIELNTESYLFDSIENIPTKDYARVLGANKKGKFGIYPYFRYTIEAADELYFSKKIKKIIVSGDNHIKRI